MNIAKRFQQTIFNSIKTVFLLLCYAPTTFLLIGITTIFFIIGVLTPYESMLALKPSTFVEGQWWAIFTANFLHIELWHLLVNMLVLLVLGPAIERVLGHILFFVFYLMSGFISMVAVFIYGGVAAGASGALMSINGALLVFSLRWCKESNKWKMIFTLALVCSLLFFSSSPLMRIVSMIRIPIEAHIIHITGFVFGIIIACCFKPEKVEIELFEK